MERIGIIRENGIVINAILWADHTPDQLRADGITDFEEVTNMVPRPGIGWLYDEVNGFRPPQPYPSWVWSKKIKEWEAPTPVPSDGEPYVWNEETQTWNKLTTEEPTL